MAHGRGYWGRFTDYGNRPGVEVDTAAAARFRDALGAALDDGPPRKGGVIDQFVDYIAERMRQAELGEAAARSPAVGAGGVVDELHDGPPGEPE